MSKRCQAAQPEPVATRPAALVLPKGRVDRSGDGCAAWRTFVVVRVESPQPSALDRTAPSWCASPCGAIAAQQDSGVCHWGGASVKAGAQPHPQRRGGYWPSREPPHRIVRSLFKEGGKPQRSSGRPCAPARGRMRTPPGEASQGGAGATPRRRQGGRGEQSGAGHATPAVPRTGATAAEVPRVPGVPGQAWPEAPARWQAAMQALEERPAPACPRAGA